MNALTSRERKVLGLALAAGIGWQILQLRWIFGIAPLVDGLIGGLGASLLPPMTRSFFATYRYWPAAPVLSALLAIHLLTRDSPSKRYLLAVTVFVFGAGGVISWWSLEAVSQPIFELFEKLR